MNPGWADPDRGLFSISVAAELAGLHPQTLRIYEREGLLDPARSTGGTRRYSRRVDRHVADVRWLDSFDAPFSQRIVDGVRNQIVRDVVKNLALVPLFDDARGRLAGPESRNPRAARVALRDAVDRRVDDISRNFDAEILPRFVDVDELCLHPPPRLWRSGAIPFAYQLATAGGLVVFARTKRFSSFCTGQLAMMLALPFLLQASLGGFRPSSVVVLWAFTAPLVFSSASGMPLHRIRVHSGDPLAGAGKVLAVVSLCPCAAPE